MRHDSSPRLRRHSRQWRGAQLSSWSAVPSGAELSGCTPRAPERGRSASLGTSRVPAASRPAQVSAPETCCPAGPKSRTIGLKTNCRKAEGRSQGTGLWAQRAACSCPPAANEAGATRGTGGHAVGRGTSQREGGGEPFAEGRHRHAGGSTTMIEGSTPHRKGAPPCRRGSLSHRRGAGLHPRPVATHSHRASRLSKDRHDRDSAPHEGDLARVPTPSGPPRPASPSPVTSVRGRRDR